MTSRFILSFAIGLAFCVNGLAQGTYRVGDQVECHCRGPQWMTGKVEAISGGEVKIRWGNMRDQFYIVPAGRVRAIDRGDSPQTVAFQDAFRAAAHDKYFRAVQMFSSFYNDEFPNYRGTNKLLGLRPSNRAKPKL